MDPRAPMEEEAKEGGRFPSSSNSSISDQKSEVASRTLPEQNSRMRLSIEMGRGRRALIAKNKIARRDVRYTMIKNGDLRLLRWARCSLCRKWRRLAHLAPLESFEASWTCQGNRYQDLKMQRCEMDEEPLHSNEQLVPKTNLEELKALENKRFYDELHQFLVERGKPMRKNPVVGGRKLDLHRLFKEVILLINTTASEEKSLLR
ncbi:hypothetical protein AAMO2058_000562500 [Amorphochlora amoebiformis]